MVWESSAEWEARSRRAWREGRELAKRATSSVSFLNYRGWGGTINDKSENFKIGTIGRCSVAKNRSNLK